MSAMQKRLHTMLLAPVKEPRVVMVDVKLCGTIPLGAPIFLWNMKSII